MTNKPSSESNPPKIPAPRPQIKSDSGGSIRWVLIVGIASLVVCMIIPVALSLAMRLDLHADQDVSPIEQTLRYGMGLPEMYPMQGALQEKLDRITSTDYHSTFVPRHLTERSMPFSMIEILYGPLLLTGMTIDLFPDLTTIGEGYTGYAHLSLASGAPAFLFYILLIAMFVIIGWSCKSLNCTLKFVIGIAVTWLVWSILMGLLAGLLTRPVVDVANNVLGRVDNPLKYAPRFWDFLGAPLKVFIAGMLYWVVAYLASRKPVIDSTKLPLA